MSKENLDAHDSPNCVAETVSGNIATNIEQVTAEVKEHVNHNVIKINEIDWHEIKRKVDHIELKKQIGWQDILIGALIPIVIELLCKVRTLTIRDAIPIGIWGIIYVLWSWASKKWTVFQSDENTKDIVHLQDLKEIVDRVDKTQ